MLFTDFVFIFVYLPVTLAGYFLLGRQNDKAAGYWLLTSSLAFYGWWDWRYLALLLTSIAANFLVGSAIQAAHARDNPELAHKWLLAGVVGNLAALAYFKYFAFLLANTIGLLVSNYQAPAITLPIGISFFCFTQLAYLVDTYRRKITESNPVHYGLFVTYFPHLIAGPVLHHSEMMPQFANRANRIFQWNNFTAGVALFLIGLFKKVLVADWAQVYVADAFRPSEVLGLTPLEAWGAALSYTFQLYFDFSGYTDMALGLSRMFNIRLPLNFDSPYKSRSITDFWRRWHMTLSRFLRDYLYISLGGNRHGASRRYINLFLTMLLGGLWHGAAWTFVIWGALHGGYLCINHGWAAVQTKLGWNLERLAAYRASSWLLTFLAVVVAWVFFRAESVTTAIVMIKSMFGFGPAFVVPANSVILAWLPDALHIAAEELPYWYGDRQFIELLLMLLAAVALPNSQEIIRRAGTYWRQSAPVIRQQSQVVGAVALGLAATAVIFLTIITHSKTASEFIYFNF